jgi:Cro/C1-type helix-turn-helix DNA-binding protein
MLRAMPSRPAPAVVNRLPVVLHRRGVTWGELSRRTLLPMRLVTRLRAAGANPRLAVAERVAAALGVPIERLWSLAPPRRRR